MVGTTLVVPYPHCMQAAPELLSTTMQISGQLEWPTMNNEQNDCFGIIGLWWCNTTMMASWKDNFLVEWIVKCACCDCFFPVQHECFYSWAVVAEDEHGGLRNESERRWWRWAWRPHGTIRNDSQYGRVTLGKSFFTQSCEILLTQLHCHARSICYVHNSLHRYVFFMYINCLCTSRALFY